MRAWPLVAFAACAHPGGAPSAGGPAPRPPTVTRSELVLKCAPPDAEVALDGVPQGTCADYDGSAGALGLGRSSRVQVKKDGFLPWEGWVEADGTRVVVDIKLTRKEGSTR